MKTRIQPAESVTIKFHFTDEYKERVIDEKRIDSWTQVSVSVGDTYIWGSKEQGIRGFACGIVLNLLESVNAVISNERYVIEFEYGPSWMIVEPWEERSVNIARSSTLKGTRDPDERLNVDISYPVTKQTWVTEVLSTTQNFYDVLLDLDHEIQNKEIMKQIKNEVNNTISIAEEDALI